MPVIQTLQNGRVPVKIYTHEVDASALQQLHNLAQLPFIYKYVAAMPDVHAGIGATVGSVIPTQGAIIPAAVGVDIGCGMHALRLSLKADQLPDNLKKLRLAIEGAVPVGFAMHEQTPNVAAASLHRLATGLEGVLKKHPGLGGKRQGPTQSWARQLGSLGGGNHFIELCLDENQHVWIMLHSGSRGIGNALGSYFIALAKEDMRQHLANLPDKNLAYFQEGTRYFDDYLEAVQWAQDYALINRREMLRLVVAALRTQLPTFELSDEAIHCHHNYVAVEQHFGETVYVTRKGAIRAGKDELGIIPGSMGTGSYIVRGLGNPEAFFSCAHGAGRRMSRTQAKQRFTSDDLREQTQGVECRKDAGVVDEIPQAYKDIDQVMQNQSDLVEIVHSLKQIVCIKG